MWQTVVVGGDLFTFRFSDDCVTPESVFDNVRNGRDTSLPHEVLISLLEEGFVPENEETDAMVDQWSTLFVCLAFQKYDLVSALLSQHAAWSKCLLNGPEAEWIVARGPCSIVMSDDAPEAVREGCELLRPLLQQLSKASAELPAELKELVLAVEGPFIVSAATLWEVTHDDLPTLQALMKLMPLLAAAMFVTLQGYLCGLRMNLPSKLLFFERSLPSGSAFCRCAVSASQESTADGITLETLLALHDILSSSNSKALTSLSLLPLQTPTALMTVLFALCPARRWTESETRARAVEATRLILQDGRALTFVCERLASHAQAFAELWMTLPCEQEKEGVTRKFKTRGQLVAYVSVGAWGAQELEGEREWRSLWRDFFQRCVALVDEQQAALATADDGDTFSTSVQLDDLRTDLVAILTFMSDKDGAGGQAGEVTLEERFRSCEQKFAAMQSKQPSGGTKHKELSTETLLQFYAMFKQATVGDVNIKAPWRIDMVARAKYDAWAALKGTLTREQAMQRYCEMWESL
jgi:diazepam-binding inhibitor (GABA receptor modulating acyl-CoA-binding protein)